MKYYKDADENLYLNPPNTDGLEEVLSPVRPDGTILPGHRNVEKLLLQEDGTRYRFYLEHLTEGAYPPDMVKIQTTEKETCKTTMKSCLDSFCSSGALVKVGDLTGVFYPDDKTLENASGVSLYRETVDATAVPVPMGDYWYTKDELGNYVSIPITETLSQKIMVAVKNWQVSCSLVYNERKNLMLAMADVTGFDPVLDIKTYLPSRNITIA